MAPYWWNGIFSAQAQAIINQHIAQSGLNQADIALAQWAIYVNVHRNHTLSFKLFSNILDKLTKLIQSKNIPQEAEKNFWDATSKLLPTCYSVVRKIRKANIKEKVVKERLLDVLTVLDKVRALNPENDIEVSLKDTVRKGAENWFSTIVINNIEKEESQELQLRFLIKIVQLVRTDLQKAIEYHDKMFQE